MSNIQSVILRYIYDFQLQQHANIYSIIIRLQIKRMFQDDIRRKGSIDQSSDSQDNHKIYQMFPNIEVSQFQQCFAALKDNYNPKVHASHLINYTYRCHHINFINFYTKFKDEFHPDLKEPSISKFYNNQCFVDLKQIGQWSLNPSSQYPSVHIGPASQTLKGHLNNVFFQYEYIPNYERFLLFYPNLLQKHLVLEKLLFQSGKIDSKIAYFMAILGAAQLGSLYGINRFLKRFIQVGGNIKWFQLGQFPQKIKKIIPLNKKLARCIWQINSDIIEEIIQANIWTENQLAFILQILVFSHQISTVALAIGLNCQEPQEDLKCFDAINKIKQIYDNQQYTSSEGQKLAVVIQNLSKAEGSGSEQQKQAKQRQGKSRKTLKKSIRRSDNDQMIQVYMKEVGNELTKQQMYLKIHNELKMLLPKYSLVQKKKDNIYPPIDSSEINFKFQAYPILHNLTHECADKVLDLINYSEIMTSGNFGKQHLDSTKQFRKAIRYYSENLCGYFHHDYDYKNITLLLTLPLKFYIRLLTLSPVHISKQVLNQIKHQQPNSRICLFDLGHLSLLVSSTYQENLVCKMSLALSYCGVLFQE